MPEDTDQPHHVRSGQQLLEQRRVVEAHVVEVHVDTVQGHLLHRPAVEQPPSLHDDARRQRCGRSRQRHVSTAASSDTVGDGGTTTAAPTAPTATTAAPIAAAAATIAAATSGVGAGQLDAPVAREVVLLAKLARLAGGGAEPALAPRA